MSLASAIREQPVRAERQPNVAQVAHASTPALRWGPWRLQAVIAEGRWNRLYLAVNVAAASGASQYAVKALHEHHWSDPLAIARLRMEATVGRCVAHAHVSSLVAAHVHVPPYYVVMPLLAGSSAVDTLKSGGRFQVPLALWIARQIAEGLESLHTLGYVHGDVRPSKIFVGFDGHATLLDLGCAQRIDDGFQAEQRPLLGSIESLAPEQHVGQAATPQSDLYGLGLTLFQLLTARLPWRTIDPGVIAAWKTSSQRCDVREFVPGVPGAVSRFVRKLMSVEPLRRPVSAREAAKELVRLEIATLANRLPH
ncbi:MAG: serine/threonine protein kinase [Pirellulales bacterium]|nr:serine/threonine protein kinase [Pirellulales bacterium]